MSLSKLDFSIVLTLILPVKAFFNDSGVFNTVVWLGKFLHFLSKLS